MHSCHNSWAITNRGFSRGFLCFLFRLNFTIQAVIKKSPFRIFTSLFLSHDITTLYFYTIFLRDQNTITTRTLKDYLLLNAFQPALSNQFFFKPAFPTSAFQPAPSNQFMPLTSCFVIHLITTRNLNIDLSTNNNMNQACMNKLNCHNSS